MRQRIYLCSGREITPPPRGVTVNGQEIFADKLIINAAMTIKVGPRPTFNSSGGLDDDQHRAAEACIPEFPRRCGCGQRQPGRG